MCKTLKYLFTLFVAYAFCACGEHHNIYYSFQPVPRKGWQPSDTLWFSVAVEDSDAVYRLFVNIRNRHDYPYQNLSLDIGRYSPDRNLLANDTLELSLANPQGKWEGEGWGGLFQMEEYAGTLQVKKAGIYTVSICHLFPDTLLTGINDVGVRVEKEWVETE